MNEKSKGIWKISIRDALDEDQGELKSLKLEIKGEKQ